MKSNSSTFFFYGLCFLCHIWEISVSSKSRIFSYVFLEKFYTFVCYFRSVIYFVLIFIYGASYELKSIFCIWIFNCFSAIC